MKKYAELKTKLKDMRAKFKAEVTTFLDDELGVMFMLDAGYNPEEMIGGMEILKTAAGPNRVPEFQSSHPDPENRIEKIREAIKKYKNATS